VEVRGVVRARERQRRENRSAGRGPIKREPDPYDDRVTGQRRDRAFGHRHPATWSDGVWALVPCVARARAVREGLARRMAHAALLRANQCKGKRQ
jgi:hypothetical protein